MIRKLRHTIISLLAVIMLSATATAQDDIFTIPTGTPENPLLDVKYRIDMEPSTFYSVVTDRIELVFHTFICYTATYADGSVEEKRERIANILAMTSGHSLPLASIGEGSDPFYPGEWADAIIDEEEKLCWLRSSVASEKLFNCSLDYFYGNLNWAKAFFTAFRNLDRWEQHTTPEFYDDITFIENQDQHWPPSEGEYANPDYSLYTQYAGYRTFKYWYSSDDSNFWLWSEATHNMMWPVVVINDGNNTVVTCSPIQLTKADISLTSLGTQYGYMDTIKQEMIMEFKYEDYTYRFESEDLLHIAYPTDEGVKAAARAAGYSVP